jgi:activating signal cointegrator complex subunit 2
MMISGVHASTTTVALQSLRSLSHDDEGVAIEAMMGPLFDAIEQCEALGDATSALDTVVVPGLRRVLRRPSKGTKDSREYVFAVLFSVWCAKLIGGDGEPIQESIDPFCRRAKWSLPTPMFAELITVLEMKDLFYNAMLHASDRAKETMTKALFTSETRREVIEQLTVIFSTSGYTPTARKTRSRTTDDEQNVSVDVISSSPLVAEPSQVEKFLRDLLACTEPKTAKAKLVSRFPKDDVLEIISTVLCSDEFHLFRNMLITQQDFDSKVIERDVIVALNRITASASTSVTNRMKLNLANDLLWPILIAPDLVYRRLIHTAVAHSSQGAIIIDTFRLVPSFVKVKRCGNSPPCLLVAFVDLLRDLPNDFANIKAMDAIEYICEAFFGSNSGKMHLLELQDGLLFIVLPMLTAVQLSSPATGPFHGAHFALTILKRIAMNEGQVDVSVIERTFPEGVLLALARVIEWSRKQRMTSTQILATSLAREISKGLLESIAKISPSKEIAIALRLADEVAASVIEWDSRLAIEPVMRLGRVERISSPQPPSLDSKDMASITVDILKLYRSNANANDRMLLELLRAFQDCESDLSKFRQSLLVACVAVLPNTSGPEFDCISRIGLPKLLEMQRITEADIPVSAVVLDVLSHATVFAIRESPQRAFAICRHFTQLTSTLMSDAKETCISDADSEVIVRSAFMCVCNVLDALSCASRFPESHSCEVLLMSSALVSLKILSSSKLLKSWALVQVKSLSKSCKSRVQLLSALV